MTTMNYKHVATISDGIFSLPKIDRGEKGPEYPVNLAKVA